MSGPLSKSVVRSQLAEQRNYFEDAHKKLKAAGASASCIDAFLRGDVEGFVKEFRLEPVTSEENWLRLLIDYLEAARLRDGNALVLDKEEAVEASIEREKNCLGQIAKKYTKIVDRWEKLEPLEFVDTQIQEASETFLYGFYRASFLLCASAVESQLKRIAHQSAERVDVPTLMRIVQEDRELDSALLHACKGLFNTRNLVAHANHNPTFHEVEQTLGIARWIVAELRLLT